MPDDPYDPFYNTSPFLFGMKTTKQAGNAAAHRIPEDIMRVMLQMEANKYPLKVFGAREAEALLKGTGLPYDRDLMRRIVKEWSGRKLGRPPKLK